MLDGEGNLDLKIQDGRAEVCSLAFDRLLPY